MTRYFSQVTKPLQKPTAWYDGDWHFIQNEKVTIGALSVISQDATDTGLLDAEGNRIMKAANPIGFMAKVTS